MARAVPEWVRVVRFLDEACTKAFHAQRALRDAVLLAYVDPEDHAAVTHLAYAKQPRFYARGDSRFAGGLYGWEAAALKVMGVGPGVPVLLGAAGGGRELSALAEMGCRVLAFEPDPSLAEAARRLVADSPSASLAEGEMRTSASVHCASYADLVEQAAVGRGPLWEFAVTARAIVLGWGSFPHLTLDRDRTLLLSALRSMAPQAPVLLSFPLRSPEDDGMRSPELRRILGRAFARFGGRPPPPGLGYIPRRGFVQRFLPDDIHDIARRTGYRVEHLAQNPYGHAILVPAPGPPDSQARGGPPPSSPSTS